MKSPISDDFTINSKSQESTNINIDIQKPFLIQNEKDFESIIEPRQTRKIPFVSNYWDLIKLRFLLLFGKSYDKDVPRRICMNGKVEHVLPFQNLIRNQKYSFLTFIPLVLFNQFKLFFNLFFLLIALSQFIPALKVGFLFTYVAPLVFVLVLTMLKEAVEDIARLKRDREANSTEYKVLTQKSTYILKPSSDIKVGEIIEISANQRIPADLILLLTTNESGTVFIRTDQLDGETDWKLRKSIPWLQKKYYSCPKKLCLSKGIIETTQPNENIYEFQGNFMSVDENLNENIQESLNLENTLWANTVLASGKAWGMIIYCGKETKMQKSSKTPRSKLGRIDRELNILCVLLFVFMIFLSALIVALSGAPFNTHILINFFRFVLLLSSIIPISMKVNLELAKLVYCYFMSYDKEIKGTVPRNMNIPEELGRIQFLLSDKTGTLTKNEMIFKKLALERKKYNYESHKNQMINSINKTFKISEDEENSLDSIESSQSGKKTMTKKKNDLIEAIQCMVLCHNVTPIYEDDIKSYQASSPDEIALVKTAEELGFSLNFRDINKIEIKLPNTMKEEYEILMNFPFTSESKRMGIILKRKESGKITLYIKGADSVLKDLVSFSQGQFVFEESELLAAEGLRTLVLAKKDLSESDFSSFLSEYKQASSSLVQREELTRKVVEKLEKGLELIGITGVEDLLQDDVNPTLENLRQAGIKVWMITGDKVATALCIGISTGLKSPSQDVYVIKEIQKEEEIIESIKIFSKKNNTVLVIDGIALNIIMSSEDLKKIFFGIAIQAPGVICCRCSPQQKTLITENIKKYTGNIVAGVGDGGNDVGMIQCSDVGIGIVGKERKQAALAADFSIEKFNHLNKLLLWHGRLSYKRSATLSQFIIHRGLIISFIQAIFSCIFYFVAIPIFNGTLILGYSTLYTMLPVFCLILDEDVDKESALNFPPLYKSLQNGREVCKKTFLEWIWKSLFQAIIIMWMALYFFDKSFLKIVTITFSCLIVTEFLNIYTVLNRLHIYMIAGQALSILVYFLSILLLNSILDVYYITWMFLFKVIIVSLVSFGPLYLMRRIRKIFDPTDYEKVMKNVKRKKIDMNLRINN